MNKLAAALLYPVSQVVTALLGIYTIVWGLWVANPFWDTFTHAELYSALLQFCPFEWVWGTFAIIAGVLTLFGLMRHLERTIFYGAGVAGFHWFIIAIFYFMGDVVNTGGITAMFLAVLSSYIYLNCKINYQFNHETDPQSPVDHS